MPRRHRRRPRLTRFEQCSLFFLIVRGKKSDDTDAHDLLCGLCRGKDQQQRGNVGFSFFDFFFFFFDFFFFFLFFVDFVCFRFSARSSPVPLPCLRFFFCDHSRARSSLRALSGGL